MTPRQLEDGYWRAYRDFCRWSNIWRGSAVQPGRPERLRHLAYAGGWKKFEPAWDVLIRSKRVVRALPALERTPAAFGGRERVGHGREGVGGATKTAVDCRPVFGIVSRI
jgi:hypothetical protein